MDFKNLKIAILVANGFEQSEMTEPQKALKATGATVHLVSPEKDKVKSWSHDNWSDEYPVDIKLDDANPNDYAALILPGGMINPDKLRINEKAIQFIKHFVTKQKPIAAICHGPWTLIEAQGVKDHKITSWASLKSDLTNAGATWVDQEVVQDRMLVTSRNPGDLPAFNKKIIELISETYK
jgi:protease I